MICDFTLFSLLNTNKVYLRVPEKNKGILEEEHRYKMNQDVTTNKIIIIIIFITYYNSNSNYFQVAVEIAEQFIALAETNPNYTAINGVLNAPALAASRNPENSSLIALAKSLGKLAGELLRSAAFSSISFSLETQGELTPFFFKKRGGGIFLRNLKIITKMRKVVFYK